MENRMEIKGNPLYYRVVGEGKTVMLVHGFGEDGRVWDTLLPHLPNTFRYVIPDLPGSGGSALPGPDVPPSIDELAARLHILLTRDLDTDPQHPDTTTPPVLVGHSMGGYVALAYAARFPDAWSGLLLFHSTAYADSEEKATLRMKSIAFIERQGAAAFIRQSAPNLFAPAFREKNPEKVEAFIQTYSGFSPEALIWYYRAMIHRPDRTEVLRHCNHPVGFIIGNKDGAVPPEQGIAQASLPQVCYTQILEEAGHMGMLECPVECGIFLDKFLGECVLLR